MSDYIFIFLIFIIPIYSFGKECNFQKIDENFIASKNELVSGVDSNLHIYICTTECINDVQGNSTDDIDFICLCNQDDCRWYSHRYRKYKGVGKSLGNKYIGTNSFQICNINETKQIIQRSMNDNAMQKYFSDLVNFCNGISEDSLNGVYKFDNKIFVNKNNSLHQKYLEINSQIVFLDQSIQLKDKDPMFYKIMSNLNYDIQEKRNLLDKLKKGEQINLKEDNILAKNTANNSGIQQRELSEENIDSSSRNTDQTEPKIKSIEEIQKEQENLRKIRRIKNIEYISNILREIQNGFKKSVWKDKDGKFNKHRLLSDSIAGVVLGTAGGLITSTVMKKVQVKNGYEDIQCTINGQSVASYGDEFSVGRK